MQRNCHFPSCSTPSHGRPQTSSTAPISAPDGSAARIHGLDSPHPHPPRSRNGGSRQLRHPRTAEAPVRKRAYGRTSPPHRPCRGDCGSRITDRPVAEVSGREFRSCPRSSSLRAGHGSDTESSRRIHAGCVRVPREDSRTDEHPATSAVRPCTKRPARGQSSHPQQPALSSRLPRQWTGCPGCRGSEDLRDAGDGPVHPHRCLAPSAGGVVG